MRLRKNLLICVLISLSALLSAQSLLQPGGIELIRPADDYAIGTVAFSVIDLTFISFNAVRLNNGDPHRSNAPFGIIIGTAQVAYGCLNLKSEGRHATALTSANIGIGLATIMTSLVRTLTKDKKAGRLMVDLFVVPETNRYAGAFGLSLKRPL